VQTKVLTTAVATLIACAWARAADAPGTDKGSSAPTGLAILQLDSKVPGDYRMPAPDSVHTIWRYWETWQPEVFKLDAGDTFRADTALPVAAKRDARGDLVKDSTGKIIFELRKAPDGQGSPWPAEKWRESDFDDHDWLRAEGPMAEGWRGVALVCSRGKFMVDDPGRVSALSLSVGFRGGIVAYLNGKEIGRAFLPEGKVAPDTLAEMYPEEAYVGADGKLISERSGGREDYSSYVFTHDWAAQIPATTYNFALKDRDVLARFEKRYRHIDLRVPGSALRKGVNVLALEIHRAPAREIMVKAMSNNKELATSLASTYAVHLKFLGKTAGAFWWNHAMLEDIRLSVPTGTTGITPNIKRPSGFQVWQEPVFKRILPVQYGDPTEPIGGIHMRGVRNGTCSAQLVVGSTASINGLRAIVSDLQGQGAVGTIPASAVNVGYVLLNAVDEKVYSRQYDVLDPDAPASLKPMTQSPWNPNNTMADQAGVVQPVWITVQVPREAKPGTYTGSVTVSATGEKPVTVPLELRIVSNWACPNPNQFTTYVGILESPDSVALKYNVLLWSEAHWKLLDRTFALLGQLGNREIYIPLITKTMLGNVQSMVRWSKASNGSWQPDFSIAEKYLDLAIKYHWNVAVTCLGISDAGIDQALWYSGKPRNPPSVTTFDPATQTVGDMPAPAWGTPEARTFWKPAIEGMRDRLQKRGIGQTMMCGFVVQNQVLPETIGDINAIIPDIHWWEYTHWSNKRKGNATSGADVSRMCWACGAPLAVFWSPDEGKPHYAWKNLAKDLYFVAGPRAKTQINVSEYGELSIFRLFCESTMLGNHGGELIPQFCDFCGFGEIGADFWPIRLTPTDKAKRLDFRYVSWGSLSLDATLESILGAGQNGPAPSCRTQLLRESHQEAEARIFVQNAILDSAVKARLGPELAARCAKLCDDRTRMLNFCSVYFGENGMEYGRVFNQEQWDAQTEQLYRAAGDVSAALGVQ